MTRPRWVVVLAVAVAVAAAAGCTRTVILNPPDAVGVAPPDTGSGFEDGGTFPDATAAAPDGP